LKHEEEINQFIDIPVAVRKYSNESNSKIKKKLLLITPFLILLSSLSGLRFKNYLKINSLNSRNIGYVNYKDSSILGHLPYKEALKDELVFVEPHIWVHKDMYRSLLRMRQNAEKDGIYLVFLSGFRSIKLQEEIFYSLKSLRNQNALERARVSAPPGYSEHSTGFAIDIGDANNRNTDFEVEFENTEAFRWLKKNAAKYHFKLSFDQNNKNVDYEPWHWRYEGSIKALKIFEASNRRALKK
tara:strand:+ start:189 stop:914 length:726 start_codon:yes stop_codon:yes gene_type:complete